MMNAKNLTIGGGLVLLVVTLTARLEGLISDQVLIWIAIVAGMITASYAVAIGGTEWFKRRSFSQKVIDCINDIHSTGCDKQKRATYDVAVITGFLSMLTFGVVFITLQVTDWRYKVVIAVLWLIGCVFVGLTAPLVWRLFRKRFIKAADEDDGGVEILHDAAGNVSKVRHDDETVFPKESGND
jgi:hypothetical protein